MTGPTAASPVGAEPSSGRQVVEGATGEAGRDDSFQPLTGRLTAAPPVPRVARPRASGAAARLTALTEEQLARRPWCMICALDIEFPAGAVEGTGWIAGPDTVLTAGHNVYSRSLGGWARSMRVTPGQYGGRFPNGRTHGVRFAASRDWVHAEDQNADYGMARLSEPLGTRTGQFSCAALPDAELELNKVNIAGYPLFPGEGEFQYHHGNDVRAVTSNRVYYSIPTQVGESGSPVWIQETAESTPMVVGIHTYSRISKHVPASATRITRSVLETIRYWAAGGF
jgi:glutamyl endopeptidase